jgi:CelD/BcsL family acetyltransferase involved in cellulose biosynthesis
LQPAVLRMSELEPGELDRWRDLADSAVRPNPFFEPEFVRPAAVALDDEPMLLVATNGSSGWHGAMPVVRKRGWRHVPVRGFSSWCHEYSFFGVPLVREGEERAVLRSWLCGDRVALRPFLGLDLLDADGPVRAALDDAAADAGTQAFVFEEHDRPALRRGAERLTLKVSSKRQRENARLCRRLGESLDGTVETVDRSDDPAAVERFLDLEAAGWKGKQGTALASNPRHATFFRQLCDGFRRLNRLQVLSLEADGRIAAMTCNVFAGDTLFCFKIAFDETLAKFSPGVQLERSLVDLVGASDEDVTLVDSCADVPDAAKKSAWTDRRRLVSLAIPSPTVGGALSGPLIRGIARARATIRSERDPSQR